MKDNSFPKDFVIGTATASYQIEGAMLEGGRGASIWDTFSHIPGMIHNGDTGDIACDHYHRYPEDIALMKELGVSGYRMSVAWPRVFPEGGGKLNSAGLDFYNRLVDALLENCIEPMLTLYHWDLPQSLQDKGGWGNRDTIEYFAEYADTIYRSLGDRVEKWNTLNEPWVTAYVGHYVGRHAPGLQDLPLAVQVSHHLMLAHAKAVEAFRQSGRDGKVGIALNLYPIYTASDTQEDKKAAWLADGYHNRWFLDPVLKGTYPEDMIELYREHLNAPIIESEDMAKIKSNPVDFLGINYYFRKVIRAKESDDILYFDEVKPEGSQYTEMGWEVFPEGLMDLLRRIQKDYGNPSMAITENGAAYKDHIIKDGIVQDDDRINYLKDHLEIARKAVAEGIKLEGFYIWSLMDNFEWSFGYSKRFGLFHIDYQSLARSWKKSALWLKEYIAQNSLNKY